MADEGFDVRYIVLRLNELTTVSRAAKREQNICYPLKPDFVKRVWRFFSDLGQHESHAFDTSAHALDESVVSIQKELQENALRLNKHNYCCASHNGSVQKNKQERLCCRSRRMGERFVPP